MANQDLTAPMKDKTIGDAAIDGLLAGIGAGLAMALLLLIVGALSGGISFVIYRAIEVQNVR